MNYSLKYPRAFFSALFCALVLMGAVSHAGVAHASSTLGTIDPDNLGFYKAQVQNSSLGAATTINFGKFTIQATKNITISNTQLRGFAWGEGVGWIVTNCADTTGGCTVANHSFKVANDGNGKLSGYAWGENTGWINFGPFLNPLVSTVKITSGSFGGTLGSAGYAWSQNFGWIKFDCSSAASCVKTDWGVWPGGGGGGRGGGGGNSGDLCPNISGVQRTVPAGKIIDGTGQCVDNLCPNTVNYSSVPLSSAGPFTVTLSKTNKIGFAIKTYDALNPAHTAGDFATENALNVNANDQVVAFNPAANDYVLGFEDTPGGDSDFNDLVVDVALTCTPKGSSCHSPSTLSDKTPDTVNASPRGEPNLQTILTNAGFSLSTTADQKQYQVWNVVPNTSVTIKTKFLNKYAGHSFVFGYYTNGSMANFVPIFKTANIAGTTTVSSLCTPTPTDYCPNIDGVQTAIPAGMALNTAGDCVPIVYDVCPNIAGSQLTVPAGDMYDAYGNCVPIIPTSTGSIKVSAFTCSSQPTLTRSVNGPDAQGNFTVPSQCTPLAGSEFGDIFLPGVTTGGGAYPWLNGEGIFDVLGITGKDGTVIKGGLPTDGRYDVAETYNGGIQLPQSSRYALFCYGDTGTWTDNLDYTFVPQGGVTHCVSYRSNDLCPNMAGDQLIVPSGYYIDNQNNCVTPPSPTDLCPNIAGIQTTMPSGMIYDAQKLCVPVVIPDACPNIAGYQASVPSDKMYDQNGNCVPLVLPDHCVVNPSSCVPPPDVCVTDPASCVPVKDACTLNPLACVPPQDPLCIANPALCNQPPVSCATDPSLCTAPPSLCSTHPELCAPESTYCSTHPDLCYPPIKPTLLKIIDAKVIGAISALATGAGGKIVAVGGIASATVAALATFLIATPFSFYDFYLVLQRMWTFLLVIFGIRKKQNPWGTVYDSVTKQPIDPAYVVLFDMLGNEVATSITDIEGRYGFSVPAGTYTIAVNKTNYTFPSVKMNGKTEDELYTDLYFGGPIVVAEEGGIIGKNIPLDQLNFDWNEYAKNEQHRLRRFKRTDLLIARISNTLFILGFCVSIIAVVIVQSAFNIVVMAFYVVMAFGRMVKFKLWPKGSVSDSATKQPLPFSIVRVVSTVTDKEVLHRVVDQTGKYYALIANGAYRVVVDRKNPDASYTPTPVPEVVEVKKGLLKRDFEI